MRKEINRHFMNRWFFHLLWVAMVVCLVGPAEAYRYGFAHADPPADDPYLVNKFGFSWSAPIYSGYLIVRGQYIDAPYVVEQRGYGIFVNGVLVENAVDLRMLFPMPEPPPVTEAPGTPVGVAETTSIHRVLWDPTVVKERDYLNNQQVWGQERILAEKAYFEQLPCISKVEQEDAHTLKLYGRTGESSLMGVQIAPAIPDPKPSDEELYGFCMAAMKNHVDTLKSGQLGFVINNGYVTVRGVPGSDERSRLLFSVLTGYLSSEEKTKRLRALGFLASWETTGTFPMGVRATDQLWKRLSGDWSWTNDAPARIHALTNGWRAIPPKLGVVPPAKTNAPPIMKSAVATNVQAQTANMSPAVRVENSIPPAATPEPVPEPRATWPIAVAAMVVIGVLAWLALRNRR